MTQFGPSEKAAGCKHESFLFRELGNVAFRCCEGCGMTHMLWQFDNGEVAYLPVAELTLDAWERVKQEHEEKAREHDEQEKLPDETGL